MTFRQMKEQLSRRLGEDYTSPQFWPFADLGAFINEAYIITSARLNLIVTSTTLSLVANQWLYDLASDCHCVTRVYCETNELLVKPISWERLIAYDSRWIQTTATSPMFYLTLKPNQIFFYPAPSANDTDAITYHYTKIPAAMTKDQEIPDLPAHCHDLLLDYAESIALLRERTPSSEKKAAKAMGIYREKMEGLRTKKNNISNRVKQVRAWGS